MYTRENVEFKTDDVKLKGWFYTPKTESPAPCVVMAHGFSALKEHYLDKFANQFASSGMCVLVYDNRNFGESGGEPRLEVDPVAQIRDMRNAISYAQEQKTVDPKKIGVWGTSFSGGVVLTVAAVDKRVSCVVSQVPFVSGHHKSLRLNRPEQWDDVREKYYADRRARLAGKPPATISVVTDNPERPAIMKIPSAYSFFTSVKSWENKVTLRSVENSGEFEPIHYIKYITPAPVLFIVAKKDTVNTTDLALKAYAKAREPKKLVMIEGDHFTPYVEQFESCVNAATKWYQKHLLGKKVVEEKTAECEKSSLVRSKL
ncbi:MAG: alpha/beta hydrolase [Gammaproteobacteria bacterium]